MEIMFEGLREAGLRAGNLFEHGAEMLARLEVKI